jgi:hypothetical protein
MRSDRTATDLVLRVAKMSPRELLTRSRQAAWKFAGRRTLTGRWSAQPMIPNSRRTLTPALLDFTETARVARDLDRAAADALVQRADAICQGYFETLGFGLLHFGEPVNWHLDPVHQRQAPLRHFSRIRPLDFERVGDHKIVWEPNRHTFLVTLAQAFALTGDGKYARRAARLLDEWLEANPFGVGISWASSLEVALRAIAWLYAWPVFRSNSCFSRQLCERWLRSIALHATHIARHASHYFAPNTHLIGEGVGLYLIGLLFPEIDKAPRYRRLGRRILSAEFERQLLADGFHYEQSACYHRYAVEFLLTQLIATAANGYERVAEMRRQLSRAVDALLPLMQPDGILVNVGDEDGGQLLRLGTGDPLDARPLLAAAAVLLQRPDLKGVVGPLPPEVVWLLGADALRDYDELDCALPPSTSQRLEVAGYCGMRDSWQRSASYLLFDAGPHGAARCRYGHSHADALSIAVTTRGIPFLIDPGTGSYSDTLTRERLRTTSAHSTAWIENRAQSEAGATFAWKTAANAKLVTWLTSTEFDIAEAVHDGYAQGRGRVWHRRRVVYWKRRGWLLWDIFDGVGNYTLVLQYVLAAAPSDVVISGTGIEAPQGSIGVLPPRLSNRPCAEALPITVSPRYGRLDTATQYRLSVQTTLPADFVTLIRCPDDGPVAKLAGETVAEAAADERRNDRQSVCSCLDVSTGDRIILQPFGHDGTATSDRLRTDAAVLWHAEQIGHALLAQGRELTVNGKGLLASKDGGHWLIKGERPVSIATEEFSL